MDKLKNKINNLERFKYPLIVLVIGILLMLIPGGNTQKENVCDTDSLLQRVLSCSEGVGTAQVIVSEKGVVVVCSGADNAKVRLDIIHAIGSYTGFGSDKITVLKMAE